MVKVPKEKTVTRTITIVVASTTGWFPLMLGKLLAQT